MNQTFWYSAGAWLLLCASVLAQAGREENVELRLSHPPGAEELRSGPWASGEAIPEEETPDGVRIGAACWPKKLYETYRKERFIPVRREMTDAELLAALRPHVRERVRDIHGLAAYARAKKLPQGLAEAWSLSTDVPDHIRRKAFVEYRKLFTPDGALRPHQWYRTLIRDAARGFGAMYRSTRDEKWARAARDLFMARYHGARPPLNRPPRHGGRAPGNVWKTLAAGASSRYLLDAYAAIKDSPIVSDNDHANFYRLFLEHARWLRYTTTPSFPGVWNPYNTKANWGVYQLEGVLGVAAYFPELAESDDWQRHALRNIGAHMDWNILPDGGEVERSYSYTLQLLGQYTYLYQVMKAFGIAPPPRYESNLERLNEFVAKLYNPSGPQVPFGDTHRRGGALRVRLHPGLVAFANPILKFVGGMPDDRFLNERAKLFHRDDPADAVERIRALAPVAPAESEAFPEIGWILMRSGWENGPTMVALSHSSNPAFAHPNSDLLGLDVWARGGPLTIKLQGLVDYKTGYPENILRTPRQANTVVLREEHLLRGYMGSLRNFVSTDAADYVHAEHLSYREGKVLCRRRVLFVKPDWLLVLDDIEGEGDADLLWQTHCDVFRPTVSRKAAELVRGNGRLALQSLDDDWAIESLPVKDVKTPKTVHLLTRQRSCRLPTRFVTIYLITDAKEKAAIEFERITGDAIGGIAFSRPRGPVHKVRWEGEGSEARFLVWKRPTDEQAFVFSDGNASPSLHRILTREGLRSAFNGRTTSASRVREARQISPSSVEAFLWSGRVDESPPKGRCCRRVLWRTERPAVHSVLYREKGKAAWRRSLDPGQHRLAWILLADLREGELYELRAQSELADGNVARSPVFVRRAE